MTTVETDTTDIWRDHVKGIINAQNDLVNPRGMPTLETLAKSITISMETPIVLCKIRKLSSGFMFGEANWILSGSNDLLRIQPFMKHIGNYSDNGKTLYGAYGPHVVNQLEYCKRTLRHDQDSRQAVLTIWQPRPELSKDIPCTVSMQFLIRDNTINTIVCMRSSDAYLGLPYDLFVFSCITAKLRDLMGKRGLRLGNLTVFAGSSHIYQRDFAKACNCSINQANDDLYPGNQKHNQPWHDFDINASSGIVAELERVIKAGEYGN